MVERGFTDHWDRLLFRDYLVDHPEVAREYGALKLRLAAAFPRDRAAYTRGKSEFVDRVTARAKSFYAARERILALDEGWKAAARRRDLDGMLAIFAADAQELRPGMPPVDSARARRLGVRREAGVRAERVHRSPRPARHAGEEATPCTCEPDSRSSTRCWRRSRRRSGST
jgi:hypothetical protein